MENEELRIGKTHVPTWIGVLLCAVIVLAMATSAQAAQKPSYDRSPFAMCALGLMFGIGHEDWDGSVKEADSLKNAGVYWIRGDFWWGVVEPEKGKWDWSYTDKMAPFYKRNNINVLSILCYSSPWYKKPPDNAEERALYAEYVYQAVNRYKDTFHVWEIWNEPNIPSCWDPPNVEDYTLLMKEAYKAAKRADPTCVIVGAAANGPDYTWIKSIYDHGGWDYMDAISIHPYTMGGNPVEMRFDKILRILNGFIASTGKPKPLWITEMGWQTFKREDYPEQAINLVQSYIIAQANGVEKLFWFLEGNYDNWGIVYSPNPLNPKPAYNAYKLMTSILGSPGPAAKFEGYLKTPQGVTGYVFRKAGSERVLVFWSNDGSYKVVDLPQEDGLKAVDIFGKPVTINMGRFAVGRVPIFVTGADARRIGVVSKSANPLIEPKGKNLVDNPSVDSPDGKGVLGWQDGMFHGRLRANAKYAVSEDGRKGTTCVSISSSKGLATWENHLIPVFPGSKLRMTGWIKTKDATGDNCLALVWYSGEGWTRISDARTKTITGTHDWQKVTVEGVVPADTPFMRPNLLGSDNTGTVWFDDIEVVEE